MWREGQQPALKDLCVWGGWGLGALWAHRDNNWKPSSSWLSYCEL